MARAIRGPAFVRVGLVIVAALALVTAGCARGTTPSEAPRVPAVSAETSAEVVAAMKANGISVTSGSGLRMAYGSSTQTVVVTGGGMEQAPPAGETGARKVATVQMRRVGGKWQVASVSGRY